MSLAVLLRQPLLHFLFLGALIFAWYEWRADEEAEDVMTQPFLLRSCR